MFNMNIRQANPNMTNNVNTNAFIILSNESNPNYMLQQICNSNIILVQQPLQMLLPKLQLQSIYKINTNSSYNNHYNNHHQYNHQQHQQQLIYNQSNCYPLCTHSALTERILPSIASNKNNISTSNFNIINPNNINNINNRVVVNDNNINNNLNKIRIMSTMQYTKSMQTEPIAKRFPATDDIVRTNCIQNIIKKRHHHECKICHKVFKYKTNLIAHRLDITCFI